MNGRVLLAASLSYCRFRAAGVLEQYFAAGIVDLRDPPFRTRPRVLTAYSLSTAIQVGHSGFRAIERSAPRPSLGAMARGGVCYRAMPVRCWMSEAGAKPPAHGRVGVDSGRSQRVPSVRLGSLVPAFMESWHECPIAEKSDSRSEPFSPRESGPWTKNSVPAFYESWHEVTYP
jgi:hypothetical protein